MPLINRVGGGGAEVRTGYVNSSNQDADAPTYNFFKEVTFPFLGNIFIQTISSVDEEKDCVLVCARNDTDYVGNLNIRGQSAGWSSNSQQFMQEISFDDPTHKLTVSGNSITLTIKGENSLLRLTNQYQYVTWSD